MTLVALLVLAAGTFVFRITGPLLRDRLQMSERVERLANDAATVLLVALLVTATLTQGHGFAGWARPAGVAVAVLLVLRRAPFPVVVVAAAATTAGLRLLGVS
jgi:branched-subunit amino acid transport protein